MKKNYVTLLLALLIIFSVSCLSINGNKDLIPIDHTVYSEEPKWLYGVERDIRSTQNYSNLDIYLVYTGGVNGKTTASDSSVGFERFETAVKPYRGRFNFLTMDVGNLTGGSKSQIVSGGREGTQIAEKVGYDIMVPGPNDFIYGEKFVDNAFSLNIDPLTKQSDTPYIAFNVMKDDNRTSLLNRYKLYDYSGYKLAVIGYVSPNVNVSRARGKYYINDDVNQLLSFIRLLRSRNDIDGVVVASYVQASDDEYYFGENGLVDIISEDADAIILVSESADENSSEDKNGCIVSVMKDNFEAFGITTINTRYSKKNKITTKFVSADDIKEGSPYRLREDEDMKALLDEQRAQYEEQSVNKVAILQAPVRTDRAALNVGNTQSGNLSSFILLTMLDALKTDVAMFNADYLKRDTIEQGVVASEDVDSLFADNSVLCKVVMTGNELYRLFEFNAKYLPQGDSKFINTTLRTVYDRSDAEINNSNKLLALYIGNVVVEHSDSATYEVALPSYMLNSATYSSFFNRNRVTRDRALAEYMKVILSREYPIT